MADQKISDLPEQTFPKGWKITHEESLSPMFSSGMVEKVSDLISEKLKKETKKSFLGGAISNSMEEYKELTATQVSEAANKIKITAAKNLAEIQKDMQAFKEKTDAEFLLESEWKNNPFEYKPTDTYSRLDSNEPKYLTKQLDHHH